jgi:integrase
VVLAFYNDGCSNPTNREHAMGSNYHHHQFETAVEFPLRRSELPPPGTVMSCELRLGFDYFIQHSQVCEAEKKVYADLRDVWQSSHPAILADHVTPDVAMRMYERFKLGITGERIPNSPQSAWKHLHRTLAVIRYMGLFQMASPTTYFGLKLLRKPREVQRDKKKRRGPVTDQELSDVLAVERTEAARDIWQLMDLSGARPGEVAYMHWHDIDRSGEVWSYELKHHKNFWRGQEHELWFGPRSQEILTRHKHKIRNEKGPLFRTLMGRPWVVQQLDRKLQTACTRARVKQFTHTDLRRRHSNRVAVQFGPNYEAAVLGHSPEVAAKHYLQQQAELRREVAQKLS